MLGKNEALRVMLKNTGSVPFISLEVRFDGFNEASFTLSGGKKHSVSRQAMLALIEGDLVHEIRNGVYQLDAAHLEAIEAWENKEERRKRNAHSILCRRYPDHNRFMYVGYVIVRHNESMLHELRGFAFNHGFAPRTYLVTELGAIACIPVLTITKRETEDDQEEMDARAILERCFPMHMPYICRGAGVCTRGEHAECAADGYAFSSRAGEEYLVLNRRSDMGAPMLPEVRSIIGIPRLEILD